MLTIFIFFLGGRCENGNNGAEDKLELLCEWLAGVVIDLQDLGLLMTVICFMLLSELWQMFDRK